MNLEERCVIRQRFLEGSEWSFRKTNDQERKCNRKGIGTVTGKARL